MGNLRILKPNEQLEKKVVQSTPNPYIAVDDEGKVLNFVDVGKVHAGRCYSRETWSYMAENEKIKALAGTSNIFREYDSFRRIARIERTAAEAANEMIKKMMESPDFLPKYLP